MLEVPNELRSGMTYTFACVCTLAAWLRYLLEQDACMEDSSPVSTSSHTGILHLTTSAVLPIARSFKRLPKLQTAGMSRDYCQEDVLAVTLDYLP